MPITRSQIITSVDPEFYLLGVQTGAIAKNVLYDKYPDGRPYATQRPGVNISMDASQHAGVGSAGRGLFTLKTGNKLIVNGTKVYLNNYATPLTGSITAGKFPVQMFETGAYAVILDIENNEGWWTLSGAPSALTKITDPSFPPNQSPTKQLAGGGAVLDGYLFVMATDKTIWNSSVYDPTTWNALDFITAQRENDVGLFLTKHHDHIMAMGRQSIEFFYDAGNPVGSPLTRREDVAYRVGPIDQWSVFSTDDNAYFVGSEKYGSAELYSITQFSPVKLSEAAIDAYLTYEIYGSGFRTLLSGFATNSHNLVFITTLSSSSFNIYQTLAFDVSTRSFSIFESTMFDLSGGSGVYSFPCVSTSAKRDPVIGGANSVQLMFANGDLGYFYFGPVSSKKDVISDTTPSNYPIECIVRLQEIDLGSITNKFEHRCSFVGGPVSSSSDSNPIYVSHTDDHYRTFSAERALDIFSHKNRSLTRGGFFKRRAYQIRYVGSDTIRVEALEIDVRASSYA
jgi:hypothetical protein